MQANGPYIWCIVDGESLIPLGHSKSLAYSLELGKEAYSKVEKIKIKLFKLVDIDE